LVKKKKQERKSVRTTVVTILQDITSKSFLQFVLYGIFPLKNNSPKSLATIEKPFFSSNCEIFQQLSHPVNYSINSL